MPLITSKVPQDWRELEDLVTAILNEAGLKAERNVTLALPRGTVDVDVLADETHDGIVHRTICECKNWSTNIPKEIVHAFRTVMVEAGANRGYIISAVGFQRGAVEAAASTNIELVTFAQFQEMYFPKWWKKRLWDVEEELDGFHVYYEPLGKPGYSQLKDDAERQAYDKVWHQYLFAGLLLMHYSPYSRLVGYDDIPALPFDPDRIAKMEGEGVRFPEDIKAVATYREFFQLLTEYAKQGRLALRTVNPITRDIPPHEVVKDD